MTIIQGKNVCYCFVLFSCRFDLGLLKLLNLLVKRVCYLPIIHGQEPNTVTSNIVCNVVTGTTTLWDTNSGNYGNITVYIQEIGRIVSVFWQTKSFTMSGGSFAVYFKLPYNDPNNYYQPYTGIYTTYLLNTPSASINTSALCIVEPNPVLSYLTNVNFYKDINEHGFTHGVQYNIQEGSLTYVNNF